ncbi:MAG TPA: hypothetical protein VGW35_09430 [Methylomirabilota bacterium]|jgi:hypothetical protein|nr:hypothetical protein [Methylomirabilota bacterium]
MNPRIPADYDEAGRWLRNFAISHGKREHAGLEAAVEMDEARQGRSYGLRLILGEVTYPPAGAPPLEFGYAEVAEGRTRFAWCEALAERLRAETRRLMAEERASRPA